MSWDREFEEYDHELDNDFIALYAKPRSTINFKEESVFTKEEDEDALWLMDDAEENIPSVVATRAKARAFKRGHERGRRSLIKEERKKLTYYIPKGMKLLFDKQAELQQLSKRNYFIKVIQELLTSNPDLSELSYSKLPFKERSFQFHEIPSSLYDKVDRFCYNKLGERVVCHYQIVEAAINLAFSKE